MNIKKYSTLALLSTILLGGGMCYADNPFVQHRFTADPTARLFEGKIYVYPSHDLLVGRQARRGSGWFAMEDYHVFSSENLMDWTDHGQILHQDQVEWVNGASQSMWAPDCVFRNGKYYFYFPAQAKATAAPARGGAATPPATRAGAPAASAPAGGPATTRGARGRGPGGGGGGGGQRIGVAIADKPAGPFTPQPRPIEGISGIDPCVFIDKDGQAYLYYSLNRIFVAKLKENMLEIAAPAQAVGNGANDVKGNLPTQGLVEGPFVFERNGIYYLTYPHAVTENGREAERLEYAMGPSPLGPFTYTGVIMDHTPNRCWTNHHSLVEYKGQWILFYHDRDLSPDFDKNRSIRADYITFNADGTINKVVPTERGVGIADAKSKVQIDRYTSLSKETASVAFNDPKKTFDGWKVALKDKNAFVQYDRVEFGKNALKGVNLRAVSPTGGTVEIRLDKPDGPIVVKVDVPKGAEWTTVNAKLATVPSDKHNLVVTLPEKSEVEIDWVSFE